MLFGNCKSKTNLQILIDDVSVKRVNEIKFLGVMIDHKICWKSHIKYIQSEISRSIAVLSKAKHFLNYAALHILYCSLILPYLNYCVEVWGNTCWDGSATWLGSACPWGRLGGRPQPGSGVGWTAAGMWERLGDWWGGRVRLDWLSGIGTGNSDACVGVVSALRSQAGLRGSQGLCPPPGTVGYRLGTGEGAWQRDCGVGLWHR